MTNFTTFINSVSFTQWFILTMILLSLSDVQPTLAAYIAGLTFVAVGIAKFR